MTTFDAHQLARSGQAHYLVEGTHQLALIPAGEPAAVWSAVPGFAYLVNGRWPVGSPEALVPERDIRTAWRDLHCCEARVRAAFAFVEAEGPQWAGAGEVCLRATMSLGATLAARTLALAAWLEATRDSRAVIAGSAELAPVTGASPLLGDTDNVFAALAEQVAGGAKVVPFERQDAGQLHAARDAVPPFDRVFNIANRTASALAWKVLGARGIGIPFAPRRGTALYVVANDFVEETYLAMVRAGWRVRQCPIRGRLTGEADELSATARAAIARIGAAWRSVVGRYVPAGPAAAGERILVERVAAAVAQVPPLARTAHSFVQATIGEAGGRGPLAVVSNGLYSPMQRMVARSLRQANVPVICFEHGTGLGVAEQTDCIAGDLQGFSDHYFVHNEDTRQRFESAPAARGTFEVAGAPAVMRRARLPGLQGLLAKRYYGVPARTPLLIYVCNFLMNNRMSGWGQTVDYYYDSFRGAVIDALAAFDGEAVVKTYPSFRFSDPDPVTVRPLPPRIRVAPYGELRHSRWAADCFVLDICSSTLGWVMAHDVPLIYVENSSCPLSDRVRPEFAASVLFVDAIGDSGWREWLQEFLCMPAGERAALWQSKAAARRQFMAKYQFGSRANAARAVVERLRPILETPGQRVGLA